MAPLTVEAAPTVWLTMLMPPAPSEMSLASAVSENVRTTPPLLVMGPLNTMAPESSTTPPLWIVTGPTVPDPPSVAPLLTVVALMMLPLTSSVPELTVVGAEISAGAGSVSVPRPVKPLMPLFVRPPGPSRLPLNVELLPGVKLSTITPPALRWTALASVVSPMVRINPPNPLRSPVNVVALTRLELAGAVEVRRGANIDRAAVGDSHGTCALGDVAVAADVEQDGDVQRGAGAADVHVAGRRRP